jgi:hypothetical protein
MWVVHQPLTLQSLRRCCRPLVRASRSAQFTILHHTHDYLNAALFTPSMRRCCLGLDKRTDGNNVMKQQVRTSGDNVVYWEGTARNNTPGEAE